MKSKSKKKLRNWTIIIILLVAGISYYSYAKGRKSPIEYTTAKAVKADIIQTVSEAGNVKPNEEIKLQFISSGRIAKVNIKKGGKAVKDQVLAELDLSQAKIRLSEAQSQLSGALANYNKTKNGATRQDIQVSEAGVNQAKSAYDSAVKELDRTKASLDEAYRQASKTLSDLTSDDPSTLTPAEQAYSQSKITLENLKTTLGEALDNQKDNTLIIANDKLDTGYTSLDQVSKILDDEDAKYLLSVKNSGYKKFTKEDYDDALIAWEKADKAIEAAKKSKSETEILSASRETVYFLQLALSALNNCFRALENSMTDSNFSLTDLNTHKANINATITSVNTAISTLQASEQALKTARSSYATKIQEAQEASITAKTNLDNAIIAARNAVETAKKNKDQQITSAQSRAASSKEAWQVAQAQLDKVKSPSRQEDIQSALSQVSAAQAGVQTAQKTIDDATIKAPIDGVITDVKNKIGEMSGPTAPLISMIGHDNLEIEVDISETDIEKVQVSNECEITFDAFGEDTKVKGEVFFIDPAQTIIQEVVFYKVKVTLHQPELAEDQNMKAVFKRIKPGMTANVTIITDRREDVLMATSRAILERENGQKYVRVLVNDSPVEKDVRIGLQGDEGQVEILSGLDENDEVITYIKDKTKIAD